MLVKEQKIKEEIRKLSASLSPEMTSTRLASISYHILDLVIQLNLNNPGTYRHEILALSLTLDKELAYAHELGKDIYIKFVPFVTKEQLTEAKAHAIEKIRQDLSTLLQHP